MTQPPPGPPGWRDGALLEALAAAALEPGLGTVLLFDATPALLLEAGQRLARLVEAVEGQPARVVLLPSDAPEDELWGRHRLTGARGAAALAWQEGLLGASEGGAGGRVLVVADLPRAGLPLSRAAVALAGAAAAALERHGRSLAWAPEAFWIAGCARSAVGELSPHLLDRFALRLTAPPRPADPDQRAEAILAWSAADPAPGAAWSPPRELLDRLARAASTMPRLPRETLSALARRHAGNAEAGLRRALALGRLARALARLEGAEAVTEAHTREAAVRLGLEAPAAPEARHSEETSKPVGAAGSGPTRAGGSDARVAVTATGDGVRGPAQGPGPPLEEQPVFTPEAEQSFAPLEALPGPYPEDEAPAAREPESLRLPFRQTRRASADGIPVGTGPARDLRDLAVVATLLEAAKFQRLRPPPENGAPFRVTPADLRSYRRAPAPRQLLVLVLDHTALEGTDWQSALLPHLSWAYVERAAVDLVQVGGSAAPDPLQARLVSARNLLSPRVRAAFDEGPGTATPLAHGLDLAEQTLRRGTQRGRSRVEQARLVVLTDGRGNVPLAASRSGSGAGPVGRQGIEDALCVARRIPCLQHVEKVLLDPLPPLLGHLPRELAAALGAARQPVGPASPGGGVE